MSGVCSFVCFWEVREVREAMNGTLSGCREVRDYRRYRPDYGDDNRKCPSASVWCEYTGWKGGPEPYRSWSESRFQRSTADDGGRGTGTTESVQVARSRLDLLVTLLGPASVAQSVPVVPFSCSISSAEPRPTTGIPDCYLAVSGQHVTKSRKARVVSSLP